MSLYRCETCGCVENTALGFYWCRKDIDWPEEVRGKALCSECAPKVYSDGSPTDWGKWHGRFAKRQATGMLVDSEGCLWSKATVEAGQLPVHLTIIGEA
jgi:hypothetical protein